MSTLMKHHALSEFREAYSNLLVKAEALRAVLDLEACVPVLHRKAQISAIIRVVCASYGVSVEAVLGRSKTNDLVVPRWVAMHFCREMLQIPYQEIGNAFGNRDHGGVLYALDELRTRISREPLLARQVQCVAEMVQKALADAA
jgi:chromosomal replication initiator protein